MISLSLVPDKYPFQSFHRSSNVCLFLFQQLKRKQKNRQPLVTMMMLFGWWWILLLFQKHCYYQRKLNWLKTKPPPPPPTPPSVWSNWLFFNQIIFQCLLSVCVCVCVGVHIHSFIVSFPICNYSGQVKPNQTADTHTHTHQTKHLFVWVCGLFFFTHFYSGWGYPRWLDPLCCRRNQTKPKFFTPNHIRFYFILFFFCSFMFAPTSSCNWWLVSAIFFIWKYLQKKKIKNKNFHFLV